MSIEIVRYQSWPNADGYRSVQVAVDGRLSWPFDIHESVWGPLDEDGRMKYLEHSARTLIGRYGDARSTRINEAGDIVPLFGEDENVNP